MLPPWLAACLATTVELVCPVLLAVIITKGPERLSLDHLIARRLEARRGQPA